MIEMANLARVVAIVALVLSGTTLLLVFVLWASFVDAVNRLERGYVRLEKHVADGNSQLWRAKRNTREYERASRRRIRETMRCHPWRPE